MKELIETLTKIEKDFLKGHYTSAEMYDLIHSISKGLKTKHFIN